MPPVLRGGRKAVKVKGIRKGKSLGRSCESETFEVNVIVKRKGRERKVKLAERQFFKGRPPRGLGLYPLRDPIKQFGIMTELKHLNTSKSWACTFSQQSD